jgi:hypothetical protein
VSRLQGESISSRLADLLLATTADEAPVDHAHNVALGLASATFDPAIDEVSASAFDLALSALVAEW